MRQLLSIIVTVFILFSFSFSACQSHSSKAEIYAGEHNLPVQDVELISQLEFDANTQSLIGQLSTLPLSVQKDTNTLNYLKEVSADRKVSEDELFKMLIAAKIFGLSGYQTSVSSYIPYVDSIPYVLSNKNPNLMKSYDYLSSKSDKALQNLVLAGIDDNITNYILFISSLEDQELAKAALESKLYVRFGVDNNISKYILLVSSLPDKIFAKFCFDTRLCVRDGIIDELEQKFLHDPDKYLKDIYNHYWLQIDIADHELASKLKQLPNMSEEPNIKAIRSVEAILTLAENAKGKPVIEKIYGKGIERKMWPIPLERLFYICSNKDIDVDNPQDDEEIGYCLKLAEFQEKYSSEMDQQGWSDTKPAIRGVSHCFEPLGWLLKTKQDQKLDYVLMRWALRINAVRLWGFNNGVINDHIIMAQDEGIDVWLQYHPIYGFPDMSKDEYKTSLLEFAGMAEKYNVKYLFVGNEFDLWWRSMGGYLCVNYDNHNDRYSGKLSDYINELVSSVRSEFTGKITYADWGANWNIFDYINWGKMDVVSSNMYIQEGKSDYQFSNAIKKITSKYSKPVIISETGSQTITEAAEAGGNYLQAVAGKVHYDPEMQATIIDRELGLIFISGVEGVFIYSWDEGHTGQEYDKNRLGFGIWDYIKKEPKPAFWTVYKYYKD